MSKSKKKSIIQKLILILIIAIAFSLIAIRQVEAEGYRLKPIFTSKTVSTIQVAVNEGIMSSSFGFLGGVSADPRVIDGKVVHSESEAEIFEEYNVKIKPKLNYMEHPTWLFADFNFSLWCNQHGADIDGFLTAPEQHYWAWVDKTDGGPTAYQYRNPYYWYRRAPGKGMINCYYDQWLAWRNNIYSGGCHGHYAQPYQGDHWDHGSTALQVNLSDAMPKKHNPLMSIYWTRQGTYDIPANQDGIFVFTQQNVYKNAYDVPNKGEGLTDEQKSKGFFNSDEKQAALWELKYALDGKTGHFNIKGRDNDKEDRNLGFIAQNYQVFYDKIHDMTGVEAGEEDAYYTKYIDAMYVDENGNIQERDEEHVREVEKMKLKNESEAHRTFVYDDSYIQITPEKETWILGPYVIDYTVDDKHLDSYDIKGTGKSVEYGEEDPWNGQPAPTPDPSDPLGPEPTLPPEEEGSEIVYDKVRFNAVQKITVYNQDQDDIIELGGKFKIAYKCFEGEVSEEGLEKRCCDYEPYWQKEMGELYEDERYWYDSSGAGYYIIADGKEVPAFLSRKPFYIVVERGDMTPEQFKGFYAKIDIQYLESTKGEIADYIGEVMFYYYNVIQQVEGFFYSGGRYETTGNRPHTHKWHDMSKTLYTDTYIFELQREKSSLRAQDHVSWNHTEGTYDRTYKRRSIIITSFKEPTVEPPSILLEKTCGECGPLYGAEFFIELHITGHDFKFNEDIDKTIKFYRVTNLAGAIVITADEIADYGVYLQWLKNCTIEAHVKEIKAPGGHMISIPTKDFSVTLEKGQITSGGSEGGNVWYLGEWDNEHSETPEIILEKMVDGQDGLAENVEAFFDIHVAYTKPGGDLSENGTYLINTGELVDNRDNIIRGKTYRGLLKLTAEDFASLRDPLKLNGYTGVITLDITEIRTKGATINPRGVDITLVYYNGKLLNYTRYTNAEVIAHYAYDNPMATIYNYVKGIVTGDDTAIADEETVKLVEEWARSQMEKNGDMKFIDVLGWLAKHIEENYINDDGTFNQINETKASTMTVIDEDGKVRIVFENDAEGGPELPDITPTPTPDITPNPYLMDIAGTAFLDERTTKDSEKESNGKYDLGEMLLSGIEVTLYESDGTKAELIPNDDGSINHNPTVTDENGRYVFKNVDPMKTYYVEFKYNGVEYETTKEGSPATYNSEEWMTSAKAVQEGKPSVDTTVIDKRDKAYNYEELSTLYAEITQLALDHIRNNKTEQLDMEKIRQQVEGAHKDGVEDGNPKQDPEIKKKMQFIRDAEVKAYAGYSNTGGGKSEQYPHESIRKTFIVNINPINPGYDKVENAEDPNVPLLYPGQREVHLGLVTKPGIKLSLHSDIVDTTVSMNNYDTTYDYFKEETNYHQYMYEEDYHYLDPNRKGENVSEFEGSGDLIENGYAYYTEDKVHFYITYDIQVTSHTTLDTNIDKIVNYHNKHLTFNPGGYTTTKGTKIEAITSYTGPDAPEKLTNELGVSASEVSGLDGLKGVEDRYKALLITIGNNKIGEGEANAKHVRITFEMIKDGDASSEEEKRNAEAILDEKLWQDKRGTDENVEDMIMRSWILGNYSEIYQYSTTEGYLDRESRPQNFIIKDFEEANKKFQKAFIEYILNGGDEHEQRRWYNRMEQMRESDAWYVGITLTNSIYNRILQGNVWEAINWTEDSKKRIVSSLDLQAEFEGEDEKGKYAIFPDDENPVEGLKNNKDEDRPKEDLNLANIKVELVELVKDKPISQDNGAKEDYDSAQYNHGEKEGCTQIVRAVTTTGADGSYKFESYIAGDYTVRFVYGGADTQNGEKPIVSKISRNTFNTSDQEKEYEEEYPDYLPINGQYYQSTKANPNTNVSKYWYKTKNYENIGTEEETAIDLAEDEKDFKKRYSDAYDDAYTRKTQMLSEIKNDDKGLGLDIVQEKSRKSIDQDMIIPQEQKDEPDIKYPTSSDFNYQGNVSVDGAGHENPRGTILSEGTWHDDPIYAYTSTMELEIEYIRPEITGMKENDHYKYEIENIDFGVTPRAYNDVDITQYVSNIKLFNQDKNGGEDKLEADVNFNEEGQRIDADGNEFTTKEDAEDYYGQFISDLLEGINQGTLQDGTFKIEYDQEMLQNLRVEFTYSVLVRNKSLYQKNKDDEKEDEYKDGLRENVYDKIKYIYKDFKPIAVIYYQEDGSSAKEQTAQLGGEVENLEKLVFYENDTKDGEEQLRKNTIVYHNKPESEEEYYSKDSLEKETSIKRRKDYNGENKKRTDNFKLITEFDNDAKGYSDIITSQVEKIIDFVNEPLQFRRPEEKDKETGAVKILQNQNWMVVSSDDFISSRENYSRINEDDDSKKTRNVRIDTKADGLLTDLEIDGEILYDTDKENTTKKTKLVTANSGSIMYTRKDDGITSLDEKNEDKTNLYAKLYPGKMKKDKIVLGYNLSTSITDSNKYEYPNQAEITELRNTAGKIVDIEGYEMNRKETSKVRHLRDIQYGECDITSDLEGNGEINNLGDAFDKTYPIATGPEKDYYHKRLEDANDKARTMRYTPTISLARAGTIFVTAPTGVDEKTNTTVIILGVAFAGLVIFAIGIVLIKKFVIPRKN